VEQFLLPRRDFVPAYLKTHESGKLREKVKAAQALELAPTAGLWRLDSRRLA
jgi:hypothetical protein